MKRFSILMLLTSLMMTAAVALNAEPKEKDEVVRILAIGNSFSLDALENHLVDYFSDGTLSLSADDLCVIEEMASAYEQF